MGGGGSGFSSYKGPTECCDGYVCQVNAYFKGYSESMAKPTTTKSVNETNTVQQCAGKSASCEQEPCCEGLLCRLPSWSNQWYKGTKTCKPKDGVFVDEVLAVKFHDL